MGRFCRCWRSLALSTALQLTALQLIALQPTLAHAGETPDTTERRVVFSDNTPDWLRAVGRLKVPGSKYHEGRRAHYLEDCSATLVGRPGTARADVLVTAWHCLEFYHDLSRPILFSLPVKPGTDPGPGLEAYRLADGGGMDADWAILRLHRSLPTQQVRALLLHPGAADPARPISMAGYSRDAGLGDHGRQLTFDPDCLITRQGQRISDSNCTAYKGASGGAVVQLLADGQPRYSGVVSTGDSASVSNFVPVAGFRRTLEQFLR
jgi:hypothetical protein